MRPVPVGLPVASPHSMVESRRGLYIPYASVKIGAVVRSRREEE
jgi:hypothetical protein